MKKKLFASLLVGSAVIGASLAPLSAQAVTTGNTPVQVEFGGGALPDGDGGATTVRPDPGATNSDFDLLFIPNEYNFGKLSISDDLTKPILAREPGYPDYVGVGDLRGTKEGWHLTAQVNGMKLGSESLQGYIEVTGSMTIGAVVYDETLNEYIAKGAPNIPPELLPQIASEGQRSINLEGAATLIANAPAGTGQGTFRTAMFKTTLNITTPYQQIKAGAYTGNVTWNLVAGPSI
ncbi:WxL domain-containing protein [Enterococcus faecalis]|uniref:WxL domain-containing protein n=1 Tax=Enterococcus faecalis TaxID=1351 RepID=UPI000DE86DA4|nr:WxL domain-containing protein [Enterococcus faecalis]EGO8125457.1 WxL domain-containing protein [Enterococcus faecalis]EGO8370594.1 WxL domain-containing protein [Enterococcus faecalis]EKG8797750.1 WxL domain-containing protein [Enterococcus faecalis]EKJ3566472.1 WxL domain-containing protein [Enterococcus faecalis]ELS1301750.1 WxL domain-containing protein [Enterococcus faecalis]